MYGTHSELSERNIDTVQLLGLIESEKNEQDVFAYKDCIDEDSDEDIESNTLGVKSQSFKPRSDLKSPHHRKDCDHEMEEASLYSAPSVMSLESDLGTGRHGAEVRINVGIYMRANSFT